MPSLLAWRFLHKSGITRAFRAARHRRTLTVVAFHRVLPEHDPRWFGADPAYTVTDRLFRDCLGFFKSGFHVVGLERVISARERGEPLPDHALLITFDDGWADTEEVALPVLSELGLSACVFVVTGAVGRARPFWQEQVFAAWSEGRLSPTEADRLWREAGEKDGEEPPYWGEMASLRRLIERLAPLEGPGLDALLGARAELLESGGRPAMLSVGGLRRLVEAGFQVGSHGRSHRPLTRVEDPMSDLRRSREQLAELLGGERGGTASFSFPHGASTPELEQQAIEAGYRLLFTSREHLNRVGPEGPPPSLGRLPIIAAELLDRDKRFRPELLARWLYARPVAP